MRTSPKTQLWLQQLEKLDIYIKANGWELFQSSNVIDLADSEKQTIFNKSVQDKEIQVYSCLHECGHMKLFDLPNYNKVFKMVSQSRQKKTYGTQVYRVGRIEEELKAWEEAEKIAESLCIPLNQKRFLRLKAVCISDYMEWALRPRNARTNKKKNNDNG